MKGTKLYLAFLLFGVALLINSCSYEGPDDIPGNSGCDIENLAYEPTIKTLINSNCALPACHGGTKPPRLTTYVEVYSNRAEIMNQAIVLKNMPKNASLSPCSFSQLQTWLENGAPQFPGETGGTNIKCDSTPILAYNPHIKSIIEKNCALADCHKDGEKIPYFVNYITVFNNRQRILQLIEIDSMPPKGSLDSCSKLALRKWLDSGAIKNLGDANGGCESSPPVYTNDMALLFTNSCAVNGCHDGSHDDMNFKKYSDFTEIRDDGKLNRIKQRINHSDPDKRMPRKGSLDPCSIQRIEDWIDANIPEN